MFWGSGYQGIRSHSQLSFPITFAINFMSFHKLSNWGIHYTVRYTTCCCWKIQELEYWWHWWPQKKVTGMDLVTIFPAMDNFINIIIIDYIYMYIIWNLQEDTKLHPHDFYLAFPHGPKFKTQRGPQILVLGYHEIPWLGREPCVSLAGAKSSSSF